MIAALLVPFLGSLAGKLAGKLLGSMFDKSSEAPAADGAKGGVKESFQALLNGKAAAETTPAAATPATLAATDQVNALAVLGRPTGATPSLHGFGRPQLIALYVDHQAP